MKRRILTVAALALTAATSSTAQAQGRGAPVARPFSFGVSAGAAIPTGKTSDAATTGLGITGLVDYRTPTMPFTLRGELSYDRFGIKDLPSSIDGHHGVLAGIVNFVAAMPSSGSIAPYFIGGPGVYSVKTVVSDNDVEVSAKKTAMGLNGGMGLNFRIGTIGAFAEARYHYVFSKDKDKGFENMQHIPLSFGIRF
jgi:hypothetical protein